MKKIFALAIIIMPAGLIAQSLERQVIASGGNSSSNGSVMVSATIGEAVAAAASSATIILTQGFQQADPVSIGIEELEAGLTVTAFPNPATDAVLLDLSAEKRAVIYAGLYDIFGKDLIPVETLEVSGSRRYTIRLAGLAPGRYFIRLTNKQGTVKRTITIEKTY